ncbi:MAG TPA: 2-oxoglutarate dehydrogenase E1 component [Armatimonadota bacterium]|jgi:2-oxoglutarate dehydrogenase E1 component
MTDLSIFYGPNAGYALDLYDQYRQDPGSVDPETRALCQEWAAVNGDAPAIASPPSEGPPAAGAAERPPAPPLAEPLSRSELEITKIVGTARLARMIREVGHLGAHFDALGTPPPGDPALELDYQGLEMRDLAMLPASIIGGPLAEGAPNALEAIGRLRLAYSGSIGYDYDHIHVPQERAWLREVIESRRFYEGMGPREKREILERLTQVETFERFLHQTFVGQKRFSIEGVDVLVPMLDIIIRDAAAAGTREVAMGMAHRGRLNVLAHILGKPYSVVLSEFQAAKQEEGASVAGRGTAGWSGDVKYHLGGRRSYTGLRHQEMPITLAPNPSHLEYVDPVVTGRARAAQERRNRRGAPYQDPAASLAVLIHGDAAFPGQGVVAETLNLSQLPGYCIGGTIHIITNNQIGFTTGPRDARSTLYASDLAKGFEIPIVHVNADDAEACVAVARMAHAYRERFGKDFLIDLVGYRRWGHNEGDEPAFTQPRMYEVIATHPTVREIFARDLERHGVVTRDEADAVVKSCLQRLTEARAAVEPQPSRPSASTNGVGDGERLVDTAVPRQLLIDLNEALLARPEGFTPNAKLERNLQRRRQGIQDDAGIDWAHAESLAFASILHDGTPIRLTGQDAERGTFSHRHLVLHDPMTGERFVPMQSLPEARASFDVYNSPLSECAVLGFEYGYSMHATGALVLWEAQFGDFINSAQVIVDQFLISGMTKWQQTPSLVLLLPHGYEGQGAEHSSARLERFLQLAANDNIRVVNCTTSAQYFHVLRKQAALLESAPRPLIVMSPKSLLRLPRAASSLQDLANGRFQPILHEAPPRDRAERITRLVLCSGKVYYDLSGSEGFPNAEGVAVARMEQLYPFPSEALRRVLTGYPSLREVVWMQEEPRNMGAWTFVSPRIREVMRDATGAGVGLRYVGRPESASPAEGSQRRHQSAQGKIITAALSAVPEPLGARDKVRIGRT